MNVVHLNSQYLKKNKIKIAKRMAMKNRKQQKIPPELISQKIWRQFSNRIEMKRVI